MQYPRPICLGHNESDSSLKMSLKKNTKSWFEWATDWIPTGQKHLLEIRLRVKHKGRGVVKVLLAEDIGNVYDTIVTKDFRDRTAGEDMFAIENINSKADHIKLRIELLPAVDNLDVEMQGVAFGFKRDEQ